MTVTIIGLGLIGGSIAKVIRKKGMANQLIGVDKNARHCQQALAIGLVDEVMPLQAAVEQSTLVVLAIPVSVAKTLLPEVLDHLPEAATVVDMGSTKAGICAVADAHAKRQQFVASHPIAGTENSGPTAAIDGLFEHKIGILCDTEKSAPESVTLVSRLYEDIMGMKLTKMPANEHDLHITYVSHLSHVSSFMLGVTVLEKEKDEKSIFTMAGSGFESTVRLAKSSPDMWGAIFDQNANNLSQAIQSYIDNLKHFKRMVDNRDKHSLYSLMQYANEIRRVLDGINLREKDQNIAEKQPIEHIKNEQ